MPIYEYLCHACNKRHEIFQRFSDEPLGECPECGGRMRKLISNTAFVLKGSGWYADGYSAAGKTAGVSDTVQDKKKPESSAEKTAS